MRYLLSVLACVCLLCGCSASRLTLDRVTAPFSARSHEVAPAKTSTDSQDAVTPAKPEVAEVESLQASYPGDSSPDRL